MDIWFVSTVFILQIMLIWIFMCKILFEHMFIFCGVYSKGFPDNSTGKKICLQCRRPWFNSWFGKIHWRRDRLPTLVFLDFPGGSDGKESACNVGDLDLIPGLGRLPGEGKGYPLQYSGLEKSMGSQRVRHDWTTCSLSLGKYRTKFHIVPLYITIKFLVGVSISNSQKLIE